VSQTVLVHAAASGVGTAAVQLCKLFSARIIGTARSASKLERLGLGRDAIVTTGAVFADQVKVLTGGRGVDLVLDLVGGEFTAESVRSLAPRGTLMLVGLVAGPTADLPLSVVLRNRLRIQGTALRSRPLEEKIAVAQEVQSRLVPHFESGALAPVIDAVMPMRDIATALARMASNETYGKLVLTW
jgi:NADPH:quinone reductase-like Zn-dependent oxidoreductase